MVTTSLLTSYSYITIGVGYLCYYMSPMRSQEQVLITKISQDYCDITGFFSVSSFMALVTVIYNHTTNRDKFKV